VIPIFNKNKKKIIKNEQSIDEYYSYFKIGSTPDLPPLDKRKDRYSLMRKRSEYLTKLFQKYL
jgi:hypothetical protein